MKLRRRDPATLTPINPAASDPIDIRLTFDAAGATYVRNVLQDVADDERVTLQWTNLSLIARAGTIREWVPEP